MNSALPDEQAIFLTARAKSSREERQEYIRSACGGDLRAERRILQLLQIDAEDSGFLETSAVSSKQTAAFLTAEDCSGTCIGPYRLIRQLGAGGMGVVWLAEQHTPVKRRVALKLIRCDLISKVHQSRFDNERQALALLNHPGISRLHDAGATADGRPWFAMELVEGIAITEFCRRNSPSLRERLRLFVLVCDAIHSAHGSGVIHRDLKPANVLVTIEHGQQSIRIIDFGVAIVKATPQSSDDVASRLISNAHGNEIERESEEEDLFFGTPAYMSPEQAKGGAADIDVRTDVYSLGTLLYEILSGTTPLAGVRLQEASLLEQRSVICHQIPEPPSKRFAVSIRESGSVSDSLNFTQTDALPEADTLRPGKSSGSESSAAEMQRARNQYQSRELAGDLDRIVMKAINKSPSERYGSAKALAEDIQRFLSGHPISIRSGDLGYRLLKWGARNLKNLLFGSCLLLIAAAAAAFRLTPDSLKFSKPQELLPQKRYVGDVGTDLPKRKYPVHLQYAHRACQLGDFSTVEKLLAGAEREQREGHLVTQSGPLPFELRFLRKMIKSCSKSYHYHEGKIFDVAFTPDGCRLVSGSGDSDYLLTIQDVASGRVTSRFDDFTNDVNCVSFSADGKLMATADDSPRVRLWRMEDDRTVEVTGMSGFENAVAEVFLSGDGSIAVASEIDWQTHQSRVSLWQTADAKRLSLLSDCRLLAMNHDRTAVAVIKGNQNLEILEFPSLSTRGAFSAPLPGILCATFSRQNDLLAIGDKFGNVEIRDAETGTRSVLKNDLPNLCQIRDVEFSRDGRNLFVARHDGLLQVWDTATGLRQRTFDADQKEAWSLDLSEDGTMLAAGFQGGIVKVFRTTELAPSFRRVMGLQQTYDWSVIDRTAEHIALVSADGRSVTLHNCRDGREVHQFAAPDGQAFRCQVFAAGKHLWLTTLSGQVMHANVDSRELRRVMVTNTDEFLFPCISDDGQLLSLSPEPRYAQRDNHTGIWETRGGTQILSLRTLPGENEAELHHCLSFIGKELLLTRQKYTVALWNLEKNDLMGAPFRSQNLRVIHAAPVNGEHLILVATDDGSISLWNPNDSESVRVLLGHRQGVTASAVSPDHRTLVTGSASGEIKLWDLQNGEPLFDLSGPTGFVHQLVFSSDANRLCAIATTASGGGELLVWEAP